VKSKSIPPIITTISHSTSTISQKKLSPKYQEKLL